MDNIYHKQAQEFDQTDELSVFRAQFFTADPGLIYLDGNSLGKLPLKSKEIVTKTIEYEWGDRLIRSWNEDWYTKNLELGDKIAKIIGATPGEVAVTDSTSVNLYKLAHAALKFNRGKTRIVTDELNFPSDIYILDGLTKEFGPDYELKIVKSRDGIGVDDADLSAAIDENTALVSLSHVVFKSAFRYNMKSVTQMAHKKGALVLWDLSHSAGSVPGELNDSNVDLAVGCSYKYLNGGPGSPAFLYVRHDIQEKLFSPIWGWFGEAQPFDFKLNYSPGKGIKRFLAGTPPIVSMIAMEPTLDMMIEAGMDKIRQKSVAQTEYLLNLAKNLLYPLGFELGSPEKPEERGSHLSFRHPEAYRICKALIDPAMGNNVVIPDFRSPDNIRLGITPLYTTYVEIYQAVMEIKIIVENQWYSHYSIEKEQVT